MIANVYGTRNLSPAAEQAFGRAYLKFRHREAPEIFAVPKNTKRSASRMPRKARKKCEVCGTQLGKDTEGKLCKKHAYERRHKKAAARARAVKRWRDTGLTYREIGWKLNLSVKKVEGAMAFHRKHAASRRGRLVKALSRDGWTVEQIARDLSISVDEVRNALGR